MAESYKILGQTLTGELALDNSTVKEVIAYEVPANTQASISAIEITNSDVANQTYKLAFVKDAEVDTAATNVSYTVGTTTPVFVTMDFKKAYSLDNGVTWSNINLGSSDQFSVAFGTTTVTNGYPNEIFVAVKNSDSSDNSQKAAYSYDGINWTVTSLPSHGPARWNSVAYASGIFVAVHSLEDGATTGAAYSWDGINWQSSGSMPLQNRRYLGLVSVNFTFSSNPAKFFVPALGAGGDVTDTYAYSQDGVEWNFGSFPETDIWSLFSANGRLFAFGLNNKVMYVSADGVTWNSVILTGNLGEYESVVGVAHGNTSAGSRYSFITGGGKVAYATNVIEDGINFVSSLSIDGYWSSLVYGNGVFVATSNLGSGHTATSFDGSNYTLRSNLPEQYSYYGKAAYGVVGSASTLTQSIPQSLNKHIAIYNKTIEPGQTHEIKGGITLSAGDQIRAYSTSNEVIVNVYGVEIS